MIAVIPPRPGRAGPLQPAFFEHTCVKSQKVLDDSEQRGGEGFARLKRGRLETRGDPNHLGTKSTIFHPLLWLSFSSILCDFFHVSLRLCLFRRS